MEGNKLFQDWVNAYWAMLDFLVSQSREVIDEYGERVETFVEHADKFPSTVLSPERQKFLSDFFENYEQ